MSKNIDVNIRMYQPEDDENIVELLKKTFPKWAEFNDPLELWRWKYINTPLKNYIVVAVIDNKIVGCEHTLYFNAKLGSEITTISYTDDLAVDSDFRGIGIWKRISAYYDDQFQALAKYSYSSTSNPIIIKSYEKSNISLLPFPVTRMIKTKNIDLQLKTRPMKNRYLVKLGYLGLKTLNRLSNIFKSTINPLSEFPITQIKEFDEGNDSFWDKIIDDYNYILEKKHAYLNWRFTDNDRGNHIKLQAVDGSEVLGYVVVGFKPGAVEGQILDLLALKDRFDVADALLGYACKYLDGLGVNTVYYQVVVGHPYQGLSRRHGFVDSRSRPYIQFDYNDIKNKTGEVPFLEHTDPSQVYFTYADTI